VHDFEESLELILRGETRSEGEREQGGRRERGMEVGDGR